MFRRQQPGFRFRSRTSSRGVTAARCRRISVLEGLEARTLLSGSPTIYTVDSTTDTGAGSGTTGDIFYCVTQANANRNTAGSEIEFAPSVFPGTTPVSITLSATLDLSETAGPEVIDGPGASDVTISGNNAVEVFSISSDTMATLSSLTISAGQVNQGSGGGIDNGGTLTVSNCTIANNSAEFGGGIYNNGTLTVTGNTTIGPNNSATNNGGGIDNDGETVTVSGATIIGNSAVRGGGIDNVNGGTLTVTDSTIETNSAKLMGGGIRNTVTSRATVTDSTLTENTASGTESHGGGGLYNSGTGSIAGSTFSDNSAQRSGGGIYANSGALTIIDSTLTGNSVTSSSGQGGGLYENGGTLNITNSTVAGNAAGNVGAGIQGQSGSLTAVNCTVAYNTEPVGNSGFGGGINLTNANATLENTIVAANTDGTGSGAQPDNLFIDGKGVVSVTSAYNLIGGPGGNSGLTNGVNGNQTGVTNPGLGTLANNGGPTQTIALLAGSPAINAGKVSLAVDASGNPLLTDQRGAGFARTEGLSPNETIDIGAFEIQTVTNNPAPTLSAILPALIGVGYASPITLTVTGSGFISQSVVDWQSTALATTYVSSSELTATIPASDFATTGSFPVAVVNPTPGGGTATAVTFQVLAAPSVVFVNTAYASDPQDFPVTETGGITAFVGFNAFSTVQAGVAAAAAGGTVNIAAGTYVEQVTITHSLTLAGAGSNITTIQTPANFFASDAEVGIASGVSVTMSGLFLEKPGGDNGLNSGTGVAASGERLTATDLQVFGFTTGVAVENAGAAKVTDTQIFGNDFGIVVDSSSGGTSVVTANDDSFTDDNVGVLNLQTSASGSVDATLNWWGSVTGPTTSANPGGAGVAVSANVDFDPWLGDENLDPYDYLVFGITAGDNYIVSPNGSNTALDISSGSGILSESLGTIPGGQTDTLEFAGNGGTVTIYGESGGSAGDNDFLVKDTSVQFQAGDGLLGTTVAFNGTAITRNVDAEGAVNDFAIDGAGVSGPSGTLAGHSGKNLFFFDTKGNVLGNIQGAGSTTLDYSTDAEVGPLFNSDRAGPYVDLGNGTDGTATGVSGSVSGITAIVGGPLNAILDAGTVPDVTLTAGPANNSLIGSGAGDSVLESFGSSYTLTDRLLTGLLSGTDESFTTALDGIKVANLFATNPNSNSFNASGWTGSGSLNALPGISTVTASKKANFVLTDTFLTTSDGMSMSLRGISTANLTGTGSGDVFVTDGWTQGGTLKGNNGIVEATVSANMTLTNTSLTSGTGMALNLSGIKTAYLSVVPAAGQPPLTLNASAFSGVSRLAAEGAGNAIMYCGTSAHSSMSVVGSGNDILIGNAPKMNLSGSGSGSSILIGAGSGGDTITGNGKDILVSGTTKYDSNTSANIAALDEILAEWTSTSSYASRINKIMQGLGPGHRVKFSSSTIQTDSSANTLSDSNTLPKAHSFNWFLVSHQDHVTKKPSETKTII